MTHRTQFYHRLTNRSVPENMVYQKLKLTGGISSIILIIIIAIAIFVKINSDLKIASEKDAIKNKNCPISIEQYSLEDTFNCVVVKCKGNEYIYLWERYSTPVLVSSQKDE